MKEEQTEYTDELNDCIRQIKNGAINMTDINKVIEACETLKEFCFAQEHCCKCPVSYACVKHLNHEISSMAGFTKDIVKVLKMNGEDSLN